MEQKFIEIENNMDRVTVTLCSLYNIMKSNSIVLVEDKYIGGFLEICRDYHTPVNGGAIVDGIGQYFYTV